MAKPTTPLQLVEDEVTGNRFMVYANKEGVALEVLFDGENPWFTQADLATMFGVTVTNVSKHIQQFMDDGEIDASTMSDFDIVRQEGSRQVKRPITHYSLDVAFYVGYRVNSMEGKLFRRWATQSLVQLATHGFVVDKRRLKGNADRLRELRKIIADIRSDEATMYAELRNICAMCKDYDPKSPASHNFFAHFQNRMLYAITQGTAARIILNRVDASKENMGLMTWDGDRVLKDDVTTAKNYLGELELEDLNRLVGMVLDFFEDQVQRGFLVSMDDANDKLSEILKVNKRHMLNDFGDVKKTTADKHAEAEYDKFNKARKALAAEEARKALAAVKALPKPAKRAAKNK